MSQNRPVLDADFLDVTDPAYHEKDLMQHVLISAVNDFLSEDITRHEEAKGWFESDNDSYLYAYRSICEHLDIPYCRFFQGVKSVLKTRKTDNSTSVIALGQRKRRLRTRKH
jgi:hypothetical protein